MASKILISFLILFLISGFLFDKTIKEKPSDLIVSLGGPENYRIEKALELYKVNSLSKKIMITGVPDDYLLDYRTSYLLTNNILKENIVFAFNTPNTFYEIQYIKNYMIKNHLKSVIIVSDPPHSNRILFFANTVFKFKENGLSLQVVSSDAPWWDKYFFLKSFYGTQFLISEEIKFIYYNILYYSGYLFKIY